MLDLFTVKYEIEVVCDNCRAIGTVMIAKGITIADALANELVKCNYCGCHCLKQHTAPKEEEKEFYGTRV